MKTPVRILLFSLLVSGIATGQITRRWTATWNGQGDFNSQYSCVKKDPAGNIYAAGFTVNPDQSRDYLIRKFTASGTLLWSREFGGDAGGTDNVTAMFVADNNFVYVTGYMKFAETGTDYFTIKLNALGDTVWTARYNNPLAYGFDQANDVYVDASGNVYVTGQSDSDPTSVINDDYCTVKYSSSGIEQWVARYNGTGNAIDRPVRVLADAGGNVYVTGRSDNSNNDDYITIKYGPTGARLWLIPANRVSRDRATSMAMDAAGNIYVTGRSSNGNDDDYWTIKYSPAGQQLWQVAYDYLENDRAVDIEVDANGNVVVTGQSDADATAVTNWDITTVGYNSSGAQVWVRRYNGNANLDDVPSDLMIDGANAVVTGFTTYSLTTGHVATLGYSTAGGAVNFSNAYSFSSTVDTPLAVVATGNSCYFAGSGYTASGYKNAVLVALNSTTNSTSWQNFVNAVGNNNENIREIAVDTSGTVFASGYSVRNERDRDLSFWKFSNTGALLCNGYLDGSVNESSDDAAGLVLNNNGLPVITGVLENSGQSNDIAYLSVGTQCDTLWTRTYNGAANRSDKPYDMVRDAAGNLYITGRTDMDPSFISNPDCFTAKIAPNGALVWYRTFNTGGVNEDRGSFVRIGSSGKIYIVGRTQSGSNIDFLLLAYDNAGTLLWSRTTDGGGEDVASGAVVDANENICFTGRTESSAGSGIFDYYTACYNSSGTLLWSAAYDGNGSGNDEAQTIAFNPMYKGPVVSGKSDRDASVNENMDMVTIQYDSTGTVAWTNVYTGSAGADDIPDALAVKSNSQVFLVGHTNTSTVAFPKYDLYFAVLNPYNGYVIYSDIYNSAADSSDIPNTILLRNNDIYIGGSCFAPNQQRNILLLKYSGTVSGIGQLDGNGYHLKTYPNPANDRIHLEWNLPMTRSVTIEITDAAGRICYQTPATSASGLTVPLTEVPAGVYFVTLKWGDEPAFRNKFIRIENN